MNHEHDAHHCAGDGCPDHSHGADEPEHEHEHGGPLAELVTVRDWLRYAVTRFTRGQVVFGHGCTNAFDEAVWLVMGSLELPHERLELFMDACILSDERELLLERIERRVEERVPTAYLLGEAWLGGYRFEVDPRVIIPRSFFAELLADGFTPWVADPAEVHDALDLCTGSGCLAILMAEAFPDAAISAVDLSPDALDVARQNVADYALDDRITLVEGDLFSGLAGRRFDLIISNPPYVTRESMDALPPEYLHEPRMALAAGEDGLDVVRRLLAEAGQHLKPGGLLAVEVGHNRDLVEAAFPQLPLVWLTAEGGDGMVFLLRAEELPPAAH